jgi:hypothetical protein
VACTSFCSNATAGSVQKAKITATLSLESGVGLIHVDVAPTGVAACGNATGQLKRFSVSLNTAVGRAMMNQASLAMLLGKSVDIIGRGDVASWYPAGTSACSNWGDTEDIVYIHVFN